MNSRPTSSRSRQRRGNSDPIPYPFKWLSVPEFYLYSLNDPTRFRDPSGLIHQAWNEPPFDGRLHDDPSGGLEVLCTNPRTRARDIEWLTHSITVRSAELERIAENADAGHILRRDAEMATLERCTQCEDEKPREEPESTWEKVKKSVKKHKVEYGVVGVAVIVVVSVALAPETGGASLGGLAFAF